MIPIFRAFAFFAALTLLSACTSVETLNPIGLSSGAPRMMALTIDSGGTRTGFA